MRDNPLLPLAVLVVFCLGLSGQCSSSDPSRAEWDVARPVLSIVTAEPELLYEPYSGSPFSLYEPGEHADLLPTREAFEAPSSLLEGFLHIGKSWDDNRTRSEFATRRQLALARRYLAENPDPGPDFRGSMRFLREHLGDRDEFERQLALLLADSSEGAFAPATEGR